jgi:hypothetical protein
MSTRHVVPLSILLAAATVAATACASGSADATAIVVRDSSGVAIIENDLTQLSRSCSIASEPSVSIGVEEGEEPYMLDRLGGAVRLSDGRIVLANRRTHEIRYFDAAGTHLKSVGRRGDGPGEFRDPFYFHVRPGDTLYVGDFSPFRFLVFSPEGEWVRTVTPDPMEINSPAMRGVFDDGRMVLGRTVSRDWPWEKFTNDTVVVRSYAASGTMLDTLGKYPTGRYASLVAGSNFFTFPLFESFAQFAAAGEHLITGHASETELVVRRAEPGFPIERIIRWNVGDRSIPAAEVEFERARLGEVNAKAPPSFRALLEETEAKRPVADRFPAFGLLRYARDGRIWIREYPRPTDTTGHHWIAFGADGRFECRLDTPRFAEYLEFGADYLLVREPDSLDVERVRLYTLRAP